MGIHGWQGLLPGFLERMVEYLVEQDTLAAYLPGADEILAIRENVDDSNLNSLRLALGHELMNRGHSAWCTAISFCELRSCVDT